MSNDLLLSFEILSQSLANLCLLPFQRADTASRRKDDCLSLSKEQRLYGSQIRETQKSTSINICYPWIKYLVHSFIGLFAKHSSRNGANYICHFRNLNSLSISISHCNHDSWVPTTSRWWKTFQRWKQLFQKPMCVGKMLIDTNRTQNFFLIWKFQTGVTQERKSC
jgi:hypothetical protein